VATSAGVRRRWSAGIAAGLALAAAAAVAPTAAQAAPGGDGVYNAAGVQNDRNGKLPNLQKGKLTLPEPGPQGRRFESGSSISPKIFQGTLASASEFPYIVGIVTTFQDGPDYYWYWCTGTIIAPNKVLTAAHCTADGPGTTRVIAGNDRIVDEYGIGDPNLVKPGVGETTRVLLRRVPWRVLVRAGAPADDLAHVLLLAEQRGVPVEEVAELPYSCIGLIHPRYTRGATGADGYAVTGRAR